MTAAAPAPTISGEDLPLLGEPPVVELANTLYPTDRGVLDLLADPATRTAWLTHLAMQPPRLPVRLTPIETTALLRARDAVADLLRAAATADRPAPASISTVNRAARQGPLAAHLTWTPGQPPQVSTQPIARSPLNAALGRLAADAITLVTAAQPLRVCAGPGCGLLFLAQHRRRRFCHHSCGHRARQVAYYRRHHRLDQKATSNTGAS